MEAISRNLIEFSIFYDFPKFKTEKIIKNRKLDEFMMSCFENVLKFILYNFGRVCAGIFDKKNWCRQGLTFVACYFGTDRVLPVMALH